MLIPLCGRSISQREGCEAEEGAPSLSPRMTGAQPRPRACSRDTVDATPPFFAVSAEDHSSRLEYLLPVVKTIRVRTFLIFLSVPSQEQLELPVLGRQGGGGGTGSGEDSTDAGAPR